MIAQLVEDLFHLERGEDRLDEYSGADRSPRNADGILREIENVVPKPRLEVALELGEVEVRPARFAQQALGVVKEVEAEIEEAAGNRPTAEHYMAFVEVPPARPHDQRRDLVVEPVVLSLGAREGERSLDGVDQVDLTLDQVRPGRRVGVFEVGHEDSRA